VIELRRRSTATGLSRLTKKLSGPGRRPMASILPETARSGRGPLQREVRRPSALLVTVVDPIPKLLEESFAVDGDRPTGGNAIKSL
jgi:hypothetical protein